MTSYFIDTNVLISYCDPHGRFHTQAVEFMNKLAGSIYLITTIREEFMKIVFDSVHEVSKLANYVINIGSALSFKKFIERMKRELHHVGLLDYMVSFFNSYHSTAAVSSVTYELVMRFVIEFPTFLVNCFSTLTEAWEEIPNDLNIYFRNPYRRYENHVRKHAHYPDVTHICIGIYESQLRSNRRNDYVFFTNDHSWQDIPLDSYANFRIELVPF